MRDVPRLLMSMPNRLRRRCTGSRTGMRALVAKKPRTATRALMITDIFVLSLGSNAKATRHGNIPAAARAFSPGESALLPICRTSKAGHGCVLEQLDPIFAIDGVAGIPLPEEGTARRPVSEPWTAQALASTMHEGGHFPVVSTIRHWSARPLNIQVLLRSGSWTGACDLAAHCSLQARRSNGMIAPAYVPSPHVVLHFD